MRCRSQGLEHPLPNLDAHLHALIHTNIGVGNFPNVATPVQTPQRILLGAAPSISESIGPGTNTIMGPTPPDYMAAMLPAGGLIAPTLTNARPRFVPLVDAPRPISMLWRLLTRPRRFPLEESTCLTMPSLVTIPILSLARPRALQDLAAPLARRPWKRLQWLSSNSPI